MKIPKSKLLGIFVGEEIYYTGRLHTPIRKLGDNFLVAVKFPEQARTKGSTRTKERKIITREQERLAKREYLSNLFTVR
jgi:hypothetical protein